MSAGSRVHTMPLASQALTEGDVRDRWAHLLGRLHALDGDQVVTLVVNDATRPPSHPMLHPLASEIGCRIRILFATGTHRPVTEEERHLLLGDLFPDAICRSSDCDSGDMVHLGDTSFGTPVLVDPWVVDGSTVLSVNSVEPHYFAGYTGGRKSFLPGVSARQTIVANHYRACLPGSGPGELDSNPVHLDMMEALDMLEERTEIIQGNGVMHDGRLVFFDAGSSRDSFKRAVEYSRTISTFRIPGRSRIVVLHPGEPLDVNLYQSEKAIYNCHSLVEDGGVLLLVSPCREGLGADHMEKAFISSMDPGWTPPSPEEYRLGDHAILRLRAMRTRFRFALASQLPDQLIRGMGIEPVHDVEKWLEEQDCDEPLTIRRAGFLVPRFMEK